MQIHKLAKHTITTVLLTVTLPAMSSDNPQPEWAVVSEVLLFGKHAGEGYNADNDTSVVTPYNEKWQVKSIGVRRDDFTLSYSNFQNSYYNNSNMVALEYHATHEGYPFRVDLGLGLVDGYRKDQIDWPSIFVGDNAMLIPTMALSIENYALKFGQLQLVPKIRTYGFVTLMLNMELVLSTN
ncbi:hypothetical protein [Vibrio mediterranei]|uniref:hypothetical protein n=1 Tax=Vibrio mediterranei TaxID=689 RepID=UPI0040694679